MALAIGILVQAGTGTRLDPVVVRARVPDELARCDKAMAETPIQASALGLRVVICDDSTLNRDCLVLAMRLHGIGAHVATDLPSLLRYLDHDTPDVIMLNINTPDSATLLQVSLDAGPSVRVIVTGLSEIHESEIASCAEAGVAGLHLRTESLEELISLVRIARSDKPMCSEKISSILLRKVYAHVGQKHWSQPTPDSTLTVREIQIVKLFEDGLSNQQIASRLGVTVHTVKNHAHSLFGKLGVASRSAAVAAYRATRFSNIGRP